MPKREDGRGTKPPETTIVQPDVISHLSQDYLNELNWILLVQAAAHGTESDSEKAYERLISEYTKRGSRLVRPYSELVAGADITSPAIQRLDALALEINTVFAEIMAHAQAGSPHYETIWNILTRLQPLTETVRSVIQP